MKGKLTVRDLLKKHNLLEKEVVMLNEHLGILDQEAKYLLSKLSIAGLIILPSNFSELTGLDLATMILNLIKKCNINSQDYDKDLDEEMTRIGLKTSNFYGVHNHNKWNTVTFPDDGFGFGTEPTSLHDDYVDSGWEDEFKKRKEIF